MPLGVDLEDVDVLRHKVVQSHGRYVVGRLPPCFRRAVRAKVVLRRGQRCDCGVQLLGKLSRTWGMPIEVLLGRGVHTAFGVGAAVHGELAAHI